MAREARERTNPIDQIKNWPPTERPRERLIAKGPEQLTDAELLGIILRIGRGASKAGQRQSAVDLARALLSDFKGLQGIDRAHIPDLLKVAGLNVAKVAQIKAALELGKRLRTAEHRPRSFESASQVAAYLKPRLNGSRQERVVALLLDGQNRLLDERVISEGTPTQSTVYVRRVLEEALRSSAAAIVLIHNHPSGEPEPSDHDDATTRDLLKGAKAVGLVLLDHVIVGGDRHYSYADAGRLAELQTS